MRRVEFFAGAHSHFVNHIAPIWRALPEDIRGDFIIRPHTEAHVRCEQLGIPWKKLREFRKSELVLIASFEDYRMTRPADVIFYNHGVGQTYKGDPKSARMSSYSGGHGRDRTVLFICPSERDAEINRGAYPWIPAVAIGVPYLDQMKGVMPNTNLLPKCVTGGPESPPVVAISFHAQINACAETRWAYPHFKAAIEELVRSGNFDIIGHCHPRARRHLAPWWKQLGVEFVPELLDVLIRAQVYVIDNSSSGYEAAALGIPTVWMNAPWYRRDVHHGLRFWDAIPGIEVDDPTDLASAIKMALADPPELAQKREAAVQVAYSGLNDGHATQRAVDALCQLTSGSLTSPSLSSTT